MGFIDDDVNAKSKRPHRNIAGFALTDHIGRAGSSGESDRISRKTKIKHPSVTNRAGRFGVAVPICGDFDYWKAGTLAPLSGKPVGASRSTVDYGEVSKNLAQFVKPCGDERQVVKIASAAT